MQGISRAVGAALTIMLVALAASPAMAAEQEAYTVGLDYATPVIAASPGDTLRLNNIDPLAAHNIVSDTPGLFASQLVTDGNSALVDGVDKLPAGTYQFHCVLHSWMHGVLEVAAGAPGGPPQPPPTPDPNKPPHPVDLLPHAAPAPLSGGDWPLYGHDLANTRDGGAHGPALT